MPPEQVSCGKFARASKPASNDRLNLSDRPGAITADLCGTK